VLRAAAAAALALVFVLLRRCTSFFSSFSGLVMALCGRILALFFSISYFFSSRPVPVALGCCWLFPPPPLCYIPYASVLHIPPESIRANRSHSCVKTQRLGFILIGHSWCFCALFGGLC
jgi:hypothetical protein